MSNQQLTDLCEVWNRQRSTQLERHALAYTAITWNQWGMNNPHMLPAGHQSLQRFAEFMHRAITSQHTTEGEE